MYLNGVIRLIKAYMYESFHFEIWTLAFTTFTSQELVYLWSDHYIKNVWYGILFYILKLLGSVFWHEKVLSGLHTQFKQVNPILTS